MINLQNEITSYITYCEERKKLSQHTLKAYTTDLTKFITYKSNIDTSTKNDLSEYIQYLHEVFKSKTVRRKIASLKALIHYLYYQDIIDKNPFDKMDNLSKSHCC